MTTVKSGKPYRATVLSLLNELNPTSILDIACGDGWLVNNLSGKCVVDGVDYYHSPPLGYRQFFSADINQGLPPNLPSYDAIVCCEAIAYLENPGLFLRQAISFLNPGGRIIISTPNPIYVSSRFFFLVRGYFPGFSHFIQNRTAEPHMPWNPIGWPQFWLLAGLAGFDDIQLHDVDEPKPKHSLERMFGFPMKLYAARKKRLASSLIEKGFWGSFGSNQVVFGRNLVVSARSSIGEK
jgi:SAM-dependent methyltransferase